MPTPADETTVPESDAPEAAEPGAVPGAEPDPETGEETARRVVAIEPSAALTYVIDQRRGGIVPRLAEAFSRRGLLLMLVQRDLKVRYREAWLGIAWAVLVPAATAAIYWVVFGYLGRIWDGDKPYVVFLFPAMLGWGYFNSSVGRAAQSLKTDATLLSKIYFPRLLLPVSNTISPLVDFLLGSVVLVGLLLYFNEFPTWKVSVVLPCLLLAGTAAAGLGMGLAALNAYFRDVQHFLPVMLHLWFFCSPVLYSIEIVPERFRIYYAINPMVTVCEGIRYGVLDTFSTVGPATLLTPGMVIVSIASAAVMLVAGGAAFMRLEQSVTDVL